MSDSHVIARKFRPQTFDEVIGQEPITRTLVNSLKNNRAHHAYLFTGARGVGKTTTARILAKALNCQRGVTAEPCGECGSCTDIAASRSIDVLEIDAASNTGVDNVREVIINSISIAPARDRYKIFIIDEVHMLSTQAFNALLKTLEEPPPRVAFVLATTNSEKVPETIVSRCQVFEFRTITLKQIIGQLRSIAEKEGVEISDAALLAIARAGEGSMRDAQSALDQVISFAGKKVTEEDVSAALGLVDIETLNKTLQAIADQDAGQVLRITDEVVSRGYDLRTFCREMMVHIRALLVVKIAGFDAELVQLPATEAETLDRLAAHFSEQDLLRFFAILTKAEQDIKVSSQPRFQFEIGLVKLAQAQRLHLIEDALERIQALESRLGGSSSERPSASKASASHQQPSRYSANTTTQPRSAQAKPQPRGPVAKSQTESSEAVGIAAARSPLPRVEERETGDQPPPPDYEPYEVATSATPSPSGDARIARIKEALEAKRKMMIVTALDKGTISIDDDYICVAYSPGAAAYKKEIESRDKRNAIEDACEQVVGRRLSLKVSIAGDSGASGVTSRRDSLKAAADDNPGLRALVDTFHGEIIEIKSES